MIATGIPEEGPLSKKTPVFLDVETFVSDTVSLSSMTLRQYLSRSYLESMALAVGGGPVEVFFAREMERIPEDLPRIDDDLVQALKEMCLSDDYVFVAHNASFDIRVLRFLLALPQPKNVWCTLEGSMCAWPELPGGYGLKNFSGALKLPKDQAKFNLDLALLHSLEGRLKKEPQAHSKIHESLLEVFQEIHKATGVPFPDPFTLPDLYRMLCEYNRRDVEVMRAVYERQLPRVPACEQEIGLRTNRQRKYHFEVDPARLDALVEQLDAAAAEAEARAEEYVTEDQRAEIFNRETEDQSLRSVRYQRLTKIINTVSNETFESASLKKISPVQLARNPTVHSILQQTSRVGKMLSHKRRSVVFRGVHEVDVELGAWRAHTYRFSSPSTGKGLNLHNCPKHDKAIAEPIRKIFRLPDHLCFVRADLANVEYRIEGFITQCRNVLKMFDPARGGNVFTDPYCASWATMTGMQIQKKDPIRQVAKAAVLGLGFCMSAAGFARELLKVLADNTNPITEKSLQELILANRWARPAGKAIRWITQRLGCSDVVALASYHIHRAFNNAHPEFSETAQWLVNTVTKVGMAGAGPAARDVARKAIDIMYRAPLAPDRNLIDLEIDDDETTIYPSVRVRCGPWTPTICWREPHVRPTSFEGDGASNFQMTVRKSSGLFKPFTKQLAIENVTQSAARNAMCMTVERLEQLGFPDCLHIHDEALLIVPKERETVLKARDALIEAIGPKNTLPFSWASIIKPDEITVTQSLYEDEDDVLPGKGNRWGLIEAADPSMFVGLP